MDKVILIKEDDFGLPTIVATKEQALAVCRERHAADQIQFAAEPWRRHVTQPRKIYLDVPIGGPLPHYQDYVLYDPVRPDDWSYPPWADITPLTADELASATEPDCTPEVHEESEEGEGDA